MITDNFICSRVENIENLLIAKNEYLNERENMNKNLDKLESLLSSETRILLSRVLDANNAMRAISNEMCYCKGFSDCIKVVAYGKLD